MVALAYGLALKRVPYREAHKRLAKETLNGLPKSLKMAESVYKKASAALPKTDNYAPETLALLLSLVDPFFETSNKLSNESARKYEGKAKEELLDGMRKDAEKEASKLPPMAAKVFYLCSKHMDCAEDHLPYQGKLYYDRFWRRYVPDPEARKIVQEIISSRGLRSMQWVINKPVWLITRPNCRHYFRQISIADAIGNVPSILSQITSDEGPRGGFQTIYHSTRGAWYTGKNVEAIIGKYRERLEFHRGLYHAFPSEALRDAMRKDQQLLKKWLAFYRRGV